MSAVLWTANQIKDLSRWFKRENKWINSGCKAGENVLIKEVGPLAEFRPSCHDSNYRWLKYFSLKLLVERSHLCLLVRGSQTLSDCNKVLEGLSSASNVSSSWPCRSDGLIGVELLSPHPQTALLSNVRLTRWKLCLKPLGKKGDYIIYVKNVLMMNCSY